MSVTLEIRDGNPWWLSPDIWLVPGSDPLGTPGAPIAGQPAYLWARVSNTGTDNVQNANVRFYWANPSIGVDRTTANLVGTAFVSLDAGSQSDVLCLTSWVPSFVNSGHLCVIAEAFHQTDPLPPGVVFNQPTDRHVAQLNLNIAQPNMRKVFSEIIEIHNPLRADRTFQVSIERADLADLDRGIARRLALPEGTKSTEKIRAVGLLDVNSACPTAEDVEAADERASLVVPGNSRMAVRCGAVMEGAVGLVHVVGRDERELTGGVTYLLVQEG